MLQPNQCAVDITCRHKFKTHRSQNYVTFTKYWPRMTVDADAQCETLV